MIGIKSCNNSFLSMKIPVTEKYKNWRPLWTLNTLYDILKYINICETQIYYIWISDKPIHIFLSNILLWINWENTPKTSSTDHFYYYIGLIFILSLKDFQFHVDKRLISACVFVKSLIGEKFLGWDFGSIIICRICTLKLFPKSEISILRSIKLVYSWERIKKLFKSINSHRIWQIWMKHLFLCLWGKISFYYQQQQKIVENFLFIHFSTASIGDLIHACNTILKVTIPKYVCSTWSYLNARNSHSAIHLIFKLKDLIKVKIHVQN